MAKSAQALSEAPEFDAAFQADIRRAARLAARRAPFPYRRGAGRGAAGRALQLAALAPSVGNCQPTRLVRVDDEARRAAVRANFEAANRPSAHGIRRRTGRALRQAQARRPAQGAGPSGGLLRRGDRAGPRPRRPHHARGAPLFDRVRAAYVLARRPRPRPRRRLGVDPRSGGNRGRARRSARPGRSSPIFAWAFRARST